MRILVDERASSLKKFAIGSDSIIRSSLSDHTYIKIVAPTGRHACELDRMTAVRQLLDRHVGDTVYTDESGITVYAAHRACFAISNKGAGRLPTAEQAFALRARLLGSTQASVVCNITPGRPRA